MFKFTKSTEIDFSKYEEYLRYRPYIVFDRDKMEKTLRYEECRAETFASLAIDTMLYKSSGMYCDLGRETILKYLIDCENCPVRYFKNHKTEGLSLDAKKVLQKLVANNYAEEFLGDYMKYKSLVSKNGTVKGLLGRNSQPAGHNKDDVPLTKLFFNVSQQKNLRYNYSNEDIIAIPKEYNECITVDDGYFLAWGDFGQSDFRIAYNLFMRSPEHDALMNAYDDKYEALARMVHKQSNKEFDLEKFKEERPLYKRLTLATVYGTRDSAVTKENEFIHRMTEFLYTCDKYVEYEKRIRDRVALNLPLLIDSYFGNAQLVAGKSRDVDLINDALNTPIQTGTSEIVALTTMQILQEFYKLGYTEEQVSVYYVRHDEPVFRVHKDAIKDAWIFNQFNQILIDDWTPLRMDFKFGYYYKQEDEELAKQVEAIYEANLDKIVDISVGNTISDFYPAPPIAKLYLTKIATPDAKQIYTLYNEDTNAVLYSLLNFPAEDEELYVLSLLNKVEPSLYKKGYRGICVLTNILNDSEKFLNQSYIGIKFINNNDMSRTDLLCRYMLCRYCKSKQFEIEESILPLQSDTEFIQSVGDLLAALGVNSK